MEQHLRGKRVVVTGASLGIGRAVVTRLAQEGANVVANARHADTLEEAVRTWRDEGLAVTALAGSVADYAIAGELVECCRRAFGGIDVLINCAGIAEPPQTSILDISPDDWRELIDVHLHGTFNTCRHAAPLMAAAGRGTIINTSSHAFLGMYGGTGYAAGKGATNSLSLAMATDLAASGVDVNVVCPGARTRLSTGADFERLIEDLYQRGALDDARRQSALNPADPAYVASLYATLASDVMQGVSGRIFWGSGGYIGCFGDNAQVVLSALVESDAPPLSIPALAGSLLADQ